MTSQDVDDLCVVVECGYQPVCVASHIEDRHPAAALYFDCIRVRKRASHASYIGPRGMLH